jgi:hypothetical protein
MRYHVPDRIGSWISVSPSAGGGARGRKVRPPGRKPVFFWTLYAALKRRSSTVLPASIRLPDPGGLSRQLTAQLLGKLFYALELFDYVFREQAVIGAVYVGGDGRGNVGEFLGCVLEPDHVDRGSLLSLQ